jgi:nitrogenase molybdenum-iron protein NifN
VPAAAVQIGDLEDFERGALAHGAQFLVSNSHATPVAQRLNVPLLRAGFPQYDWVGYRGARQTLFDVANLFMENHHDTPVHRSIFWAGTERDSENGPASGTGLVRH